MILLFANSVCILPRPLAVVTGGTRGIGLATTNRLVRAGTDVIVTYASDHAAAYKVSQSPSVLAAIPGDLAERETRERVFEHVESLRATHRLQAMVHCAGQYAGVTSTNSKGLSKQAAAFGSGAVFSDKGPEMLHMRYYFQLYGEAFTDLCDRSLRLMRAHGGGGALVGISSPGCSLHYKPNPGYDLPGVGKTVMEYASRLIALRAADCGATCNIVVPGVTPTDAWDRLADSQDTDVDLARKLAKKISPRGTTSAREVASVIAFLCSREARSITGATIPADAGVHLRI